MVATTTELSNAIDDFIRCLRVGLRVEAVILYGSYVGGTPHDWSDIDIAVISPDFEGIPVPRRQEIISDLTLDCDERIEPIGYPSSEYHNPGPHSFLGEILRTGKLVYEAPRQ